MSMYPSIPPVGSSHFGGNCLSPSVMLRTQISSFPSFATVVLGSSRHRSRLLGESSSSVDYFFLYLRGFLPSTEHLLFLSSLHLFPPSPTPYRRFTERTLRHRRLSEVVRQSSGGDSRPQRRSPSLRSL